MKVESEAAMFRLRSCVAGLLIVPMAAFMPACAALGDDAPPGQVVYATHDMNDLQQLVSPIALYPDALLAQVLAASTYPDDVVPAAQWEDAGNNPQGIDAQPWDSSVKGVARYPSILHYMASNGDWMNDLGTAFLNQQADVMSVVQTLRGEALAAGTLTTTPQQTVINEDGYIQIIPTNPDTVYVPVYDPSVVYAPPAYVVGQPYPTYITYGPGVAVGDWLDFDLDWHDHVLYSGRWGRDRPWWHLHDAGNVHRYIDVRPGLYKPGVFRDVRGRPIEVPIDRWKRDDHRPPPRPIARPIGRPPIVRPDRGYPARPPVAPRQRVEVPHGPDVYRDSERGRESRGQVGPLHPMPAPPPREAPHPEPAPRPEPHPAPAPEPHPSGPTRGGAMGGYGNGGDAGRNAGRGAESRGGGGGGAHGGGGGRH